ncbi:MAG: S-layer homology domain-containing protein [Oscillibacter sp.]|nr:S-layer homology domain-containing protein [Oscillibacter sp.]
MQKVKRLLSVFLVLAMLLGMMSLPADAADSGYKLAILKVQIFEGDTFDPDTATEIQETDHVNAGDVVVLTVGFENTSGSTVSVGGFQSKVFYDTDKISVFTGKRPFLRNPFQNSQELLDAEGLYAWNMAGDGDPAKDFVSTNGVGDAYNLANGEQLIFSRYAFQVKDDAGDADVYFRFDADAGDVIDNSRKSLPLEDYEPRRLIIGNGSGDTDEFTVTVSPESDEVTIPAEGADPAEKTFTAEVKDKDGNAVENPEVKWSIAPKEDIDNVTGITTSETDGTLTVSVASDATAGEYTVTATVGESTGTATLTVKESETPPPGDFTVTLDPAELDVPSTGEATATATAEGVDGATWSITPTATGVDIDPESGVVTVTSAASAGTFTVTATVGEGDDAQTGSATLTVKKSETPPGDFTVTLNPSELDVPSTGEATATATAEGVSGVTWSIAPTATGVSIDPESGIVTVTSAASAGTFTVTATASDDTTGSATLTVKKSETPPGDFTVTLNPSELDVPSTGEATATATASVDGVTWSITPDNATGVSIDPASGIVTVTPEAAAGRFTVTATSADDKTGTATLTVKKEVDDSGITFTPQKTAYPLGTETYFKASSNVPNAIWYLEDKDGHSVNPDEISINPQTGEVRITPQAKAGTYYTVALVNGQQLGKKAFTISADAEDAQMTVTVDKSSIQIPGVTDDASSEDFKAYFTATDKNKKPISNDDLRWSVEVLNPPPETLNSNSVEWFKDTAQDGRLILTVKPGAKDEIANDILAGSPVYGTTLLVTATNFKAEDSPSASATIVIRRADPVLTTVTLSPDTVTLSGENQTVTAAAFDQYGEFLASTDTEPITWSIQPSTSSAVTIDPATGTVTVRYNATPETYTVQATRTVKGTTQPASAELKISQEAERAESIALLNGPTQMEVPGKGDDINNNAENPFVAQVLNQHGSTMSDSDVQWSITDSSGAECPGITIQGGVVSITYEAKSVVPAGAHPIFRVTAKSGDVQQSRDLYIVRSAPYLNDLSLSKEQIDINGEHGGEAQCIALDQYEEPFSGDVTWSVAPYGGISGSGGVTVDASGLITVSKDATPGPYNVYANSSVGPKTLLVSRESSYTNAIVISTKEDIVVTIPPDGQETAETRHFSATVYDQFGEPISNQPAVTWTITDAAEGGTTVQGITIDSNGVVSVANEAKAQVGSSPNFKEMYVHASSGSSAATPFKLIIMRQSPELSKVRLDNTDSPDANGQRFSVDYTDGETKRITASALDQYGSAFSGASWDIESDTDEIGVSIDSSGVITISRGAVSAAYTVVASAGGKRVSAPFVIRKTSSSASSISRVVVDPASVTVSNSSTALSQATAYDGNDNPITVGILWSVFPSGAGVGIARDGKITISSNASSRPYVITATPDTTFGIVSGNPQSADLIVQNISAAVGELDHVALTKSSVTVDGTASETSVARALDRDNNDVSGVTWAISPANGGVSIDSNGTIHIFKSATPGDYTITATKGAVSKESKLTVSNETPPPVVSFQVTLTPDTVIADGVSPASATASAADASNQPLSGVTWSLSPQGQGVSIDAASGAITVAASAVLGEYTVTASTETGTQSKTLYVIEKGSETTQSLTGVSLNPAAVTLDGTNAQTVTATAQGTATDGVTWTVSPVGAGVTLNSNSGASVQITVAADTKPGTYGVTAALGDTTRSATLTVTVPAESFLSSVKVFPASVEVNGTESKTADANALTSTNESITSGVTWSVSPLGNGVTVDAVTGKVTVDKAAMSGDYQIIATRDTETRSDTLKVTNMVTTAKLTSVALTPAAVELNGRDAASSTATAIGSGNTTLTTGVTWTVTPTDGGVTIDTSGKITILATAVSGEYLISAHYQSAVASATLTVASYADIVYEEKAVDKTAVANTALASVNYADTGVKSVEHQASMMSAALAKDDVKKAVSEQTADTKTEVVVSVDIQLQSYDPDKPSMKLSVTPRYDIVKTANGQTTTTPGGTLSELPEAVKVTLNVPASFDATFAKHTHNNTTYLEPITYTGSGSERVAGWTQKYFSDVELTKDVVTIKFDAQGGIAIADRSIAKGGTLSTLPATSRSGYNFSGWFLNNTQVTTSTTFDQDSTLVAQWTVASNGGGGGGGGGGSSSGGSSSSSSSSSTYRVTTSAGTGGTLTASDKRPKAEDIVTLTPTPRSGYELDTISVVTTSGKKEVALTENNGTYTFEMPKGNVTAKATFKRATAQPANTNSGDTGDINPTPYDPTPVNPTPSYTSVSFVDMQPDNFFYTAVQWAVERGITNGTTATTFSPNQACTRAQMVMFLWRSQGMPMPSNYNSPFVDVDPSANYYTAMMWAVERGITNGTTPTTFDPYAACTRAQMVMFLNRVAGRPRPTQWSCPFTDITVGENYYEPMLWALEKGITNGTTATTFSPYQACTRAQMVMFLYRYLGGN